MLIGVEVDIRLFLLQSEHILLGSNFSSDLMVAWFFAARSAAGFGGRLDIFLIVQRWTPQVPNMPEVLRIEEETGLGGKNLSTLAIEVDFGSDVRIKGVLEELRCVCVSVQITGTRAGSGPNALTVTNGGRHQAWLAGWSTSSQGS